MANQDENKPAEPEAPPVVRDKALKGPSVAGGFKGDVHALLRKRPAPQESGDQK